MDIDYLERVFSKDGVVDYLKSEGADKIRQSADEVKENLNREQMCTLKKTIQQNVNKAVADSNKEIDDISMAIKALKGIVPYSRMLISCDGFVIHMNSKYFRVEHSDVGFMYEGSIRCVGLVTNIILKDYEAEDRQNLLATIRHSVNSILRAI
ncbi:hypothetical protein [Butyrivibrio fibrisolvens]|uniref:hypothetical protein n=1 Tax=Butyrivibrio fibrisolvens TaxID=831 RepID=UPI0003F784EB|nr:hypothetical protein [Butyrivibrio fibrisolvens]